MNKIYSPWAYTENEETKRKDNYETYVELNKKYKIAYSNQSWNDQTHCFEKINANNFDIIINRLGSGYAHVKYKIIKNMPNLSKIELALLCDGGNICFGYDIEGSDIITIYTD